VVYRNRTPEEIRDIHVVLAREGTWKPDQAVANDGWKISGCPVNGPAIAASGNGVVTAWFTMSGDVPRVRFARSDDGGATFGEALELDSEVPLGRVDIVLLDEGKAVVSWLRDTKPAHGELVVRRVGADGNLGPIQVVTTTGAGRPAGFPQMARQGQSLVFAWTQNRDGKSQVGTALVSISDP
jgi:hypothetical protein